MVEALAHVSIKKSAVHAKTPAKPVTREYSGEGPADILSLLDYISSAVGALAPKIVMNNIGA